jgi:hypothetical protein
MTRGPARFVLDALFIAPMSLRLYASFHFASSATNFDAESDFC